MEIKIYFNDKPLFLCNEFSPVIEMYKHHDDAVFIDEFSSASVNAMIHEMRSPKVHAGIFFHEDLKALQKAFWKKFVIITAGGGLVLNDDQKILFMFRRGFWDLPKGKMDDGETPEETAVREVSEETGLTQIRLEKPLLQTYHTYDEHGKHILKETHWFVMHAPGQQPLVPQFEEQITALTWIDPKNMQTQLANTFPSILDVLKAAGYA